MNFVIILLLSIAAAQAQNSALQDFIKSNNLLAVSVYKVVKTKTQDNILFSPFSAQTVLAFLCLGSNGDTAKELKQALSFSKGNDQIEAGVKASLPLLVDKKSVYLYTANKMYVEKDFTVRMNFFRITNEVFGADIKPVNFEKKAEAAKTINKWMEVVTKKTTNNLIDPNILDENTKAIMINVLHFRGKWLNPFSKQQTILQSFFTSKKNIIKTEMMHQFNQKYKYYECSKLKAKFLELPLGSPDVSMIVALPNDYEGLSALEKEINNVLSISALRSNLKTTVVTVTLPKFKIDSKTNLKDILPDLGVKKIFDAKKGTDLSGIAGEPGDLVIDELLQRTFIDVSENGVEEGTATAPEAAVRWFTGKNNETHNTIFMADHPFIFYVRVRDLIILTGRVVSPSK